MQPVAERECAGCTKCPDEGAFRRDPLSVEHMQRAKEYKRSRLHLFEAGKEIGVRVVFCRFPTKPSWTGPPILHE